MKLKQNISTLLYLFVSACLLGGALFLGSSYISSNTADIPVRGPETESPVSTDDFPESADPSAIESADEISSEQEKNEPETADNLGILIDRLYLLFEEEAPYRWEKYDEVDWSRVRFDEDETETAETSWESDPAEEYETAAEENAVSGTQEKTHPEFVEMYPKLAYFYKDLDTGKIVSYNADEILYSASLIKAPYIYAVMEEIDAFVREKLPEETETAADESETVYETETDVEAETGAETETETEYLDMTETEEETETVSMWEMIEYTPWEAKYNLGEIWTYAPSWMYVEGSGELLNMPGGVRLTWLELFEYALLYSDNIAFDQIRQRFGHTSFYKKVEELDIQGTETGFMNLSARDCGIFLEAMYEFFDTGSYLAEHMRDTMADSKQLNLIASHYPEGTAAHKYGWDLEAFHDMSIIYDDHPYIIVIMTDYEDGGPEPTKFFADVVALTKQIHAEIHKNDPATSESETVTAESGETEA